MTVWQLTDLGALSGLPVTMVPAVFFDRDGVLTRAIVREGRPFAPTTLEEFEVLPEAGRALARLRDAGFLRIVVTNQPDVDAGVFSEAVLEEMHLRLRAALPVDDILVCRCAEIEPGCDCYKPRPGLLKTAAQRHQIDLAGSFMVGDRWRDVGAGKSAGCRTVFIDRGYYKDRRPDSPDCIVASLLEACDFILSF